jgi:hypothetical protein
MMGPKRAIVKCQPSPPQKSGRKSVAVMYTLLGNPEAIKIDRFEPVLISLQEQSKH